MRVRAKKASLAGVMMTCCLLVFFVSGCVTIPQETHQLSTELGQRISAIEDANMTLLRYFFDLKRKEIDQFIEESWVPTFSKEVYADPRMQKIWQTIVAEDNASDRLMFLKKTGPKIQAKINDKRNELMQPLDDVERELTRQIRSEYQHAQSINNAITSFLFSAAKVSENRQRYLDMVGVTDQKIQNTIDEVDYLVTKLVEVGDKIEEKTAKSDKYIEKLNSLRDKLKNK